VLYGELRVLDYLLLVANIRGLDRRTAEQKIEEFAKRLGLDKHLDKKVAMLSRGNLQKVAIVSALIPDFDIIILDEPFNNLDPVAQYELKKILTELKESGKGVLLSSHIVGHIEDLADRLILINNGMIIATGTVEDIIKMAGVEKLEEALVMLLKGAS